MALLDFTDRGIYCSAADVYIDPWRSVDFAIITHAHSDHARRGMKHYLCHPHTLPVLKARCGNDISVQTVEYGEKFVKNGVTFSLHPAGHVIGSAQVRVECKGKVWVASGDYKLQDDGFAVPFEPIRCDVFITECTFGLPVYKWQPQQEIFDEINTWWASNKEEGKVTLLSGYSLGKAQRILQNVDASIGRIYTHGAVENVNQVLRDAGIPLRETTLISKAVSKKDLVGALVISPPGALVGPWANKLGDVSTGSASGWMALRGARRRMAVDRGFALSDHADWTGLNDAIEATGAECIISTHGYTEIFSRWLTSQGYKSKVEHTEFEGELEEVKEATVAEDKETKESE